MNTKEANKRLAEAATNGDVEDAKVALDGGADPNGRDTLNWTPLHRAAICGYTELARLLVNNGAEVTLTDDFERTAIDIAVQHGHRNLVEMLRAAAENQQNHAARVAQSRAGNGDRQIG
jgi:uncharacterized protein